MSPTDRIVLVTGASRGLGRGIARAFGKAGTTVYLTSRSTSGDSLGETAAQVEARGGKAVQLAVDHREPEEVRALIERIRRDSGQLDILVNNAAAVHPQLAAAGPFWEKSIDLGDMIEVPLHATYITSYHAAPLMVEKRRGLIANISFYGAACYFHGPAYGAAKAGTDKLSFDMAVDLRPHDVASVSIWPGFIYSDAVAQYVAVTPPEQMPPGLADQFTRFEKPEFTGLVLDALHADPALMSYSGQALIGAELGKRYGISDIDGKEPISYRGAMGAPLPFVVPNSG